MRYVSEDEFGSSEPAFLICWFRRTDAWRVFDRRDEAIDMFSDALQYRNRHGLLVEDVHLQTGQLYGNFAQTCSMAGFILTAIRLSQSWEDR